jgi:acetyltransferase-like isoleucine patch superfamily enzyme
MVNRNHFPKSLILGEHVVIEEGVTIGENVTIGHHSVIMRDTKLGDNVTIGSHSVLGIRPQRTSTIRDSKPSHELLLINSNVRIGSLVSIYAGSVISEGVFIADHASVRENVEVGESTVIGRGAMIELNTRIGSKCTIQTLAYITGDTVLEDDVFIGPCVSMSNDKYMGGREYMLKGPYIGQGSKIGNNVSLLPGIRIGRHAVVGAGSVVTRHVGESETVAGVPARILRKMGDVQDDSSR